MFNLKVLRFPFLRRHEEDLPGFGGEGSDDWTDDSEDDSPASDDGPADSHTGPGPDTPEDGDSGDIDESGVESDAEFWKQEAHKRERLLEKLQDRLDGLAAQVISSNTQRDAPPELPKSPPHSEAEILKTLQEGSPEEYHRMMVANQDWAIANATEGVERKMSATSTAERLERLLKESDPEPGSQYEADLEAARKRVRDQIPGLNDRQVDVMAKSLVARQAYNGGGGTPPPRSAQGESRERERARQYQGRKTARRGRAEDESSIRVPDEVKRGLARSGLLENYMTPRKNPADEKKRLASLRRVIERHNELNGG